MRAASVALAAALAGCRAAGDPAVLGVDVAACQPAAYGSMVAFTLRADAPRLNGGRPYRCVVFAGVAHHRAELTVFAEGFHPVVHLLDAAARPRRVLASSDRGPGTDVARVSAVLPRTAPYAALVTTQPGGTGTFLIGVQDHP